MIGKGELLILIVNDQLLVRLGLRQLLCQDFRGLVIGEALTGEAALAKLEEREWHIVFLGMHHQDGPGFDLLKAVRMRSPETKVIVLSQLPESVYGVHALEHGASGYLEQNSSRSAIVNAVKRVLAAKQHFSKETILAAKRLRPGNFHTGLSNREYRVLLALAGGRSPSEIAKDLQISPKTVSTYKCRLFNKLSVNSIAELVHFVIDRKLS